MSSRPRLRRDDDLRELLVDRGIRVTEQRMVILRELAKLQSSSPEHGARPHFVCSDCGSIACLPANSVALRGKAARNQVAEVQLLGRCTVCARA